MFRISAAIVIFAALWGLVAHSSFEFLATTLMSGLKEHFSWLYLFATLFFVVFLGILAFSKWGSTRLGKDTDRPEHSTFSWFAMLFGTGMGIGLVFWGVSEPLSHYISPMAGIAPRSEEAARFAIRSCFMHWGLHPWAIYSVMGLGLGYFMYRKDETAMASNLLRPLFKESRASSAAGTCIDVYTAVLTAVGVATSFGMGCIQIGEGLNYVFGIPNTAWTWLAMILVIGFVYIWTAISGVDKGIRIVSDINLYLFLGMMLLAFCVGPKADILLSGLRGVADYVRCFISDSVRTGTGSETEWIRNWRVYYWAWWLSWSPFVGIFLARISKGRTIREFIFGVLLIPSTVSGLWFSVMSGMAFHVVDRFSAEELASMVAAPETALFRIFAEYPCGLVLSLIALVLLFTFFLTSANSATFVMSMITSDGALDPPANKKVFWGVLIGAVAFVLIMSGNISLTQTVSIVIAFPYEFILLMICVSLFLSLKREQSQNRQLQNR